MRFRCKFNYVEFYQLKIIYVKGNTSKTSSSNLSEHIFTLTKFNSKTRKKNSMSSKDYENTNKGKKVLNRTINLRNARVLSEELCLIHQAQRRRATNFKAGTRLKKVLLKDLAYFLILLCY